MTLLFIDGFDSYTAAGATTKWSQNFSTVSPGRFGDGRYAAMSSCTTYFDDESTIIVGFAVNGNYSGLWNLYIYSGGTPQMRVSWNSDNSLTLWRGDATAVGNSGPNVCYGDVWQYIELKVNFHSSTGSYKLRLNGVPVPNIPDATNVNTNPAGTGVANSLRLNTFAAFVSFGVDDFYLCNGSGTTNNDLLGDVRIETLYPSGAGSSTDWTPSTGSNYACVDESPFSDTDYVTASGVGAKDLYAMSNLSTPVGTVFGVQCDIRARKTDSGTRGIAGVFKSGASEADTTTYGVVATNYQYFREVREDKPGGTGWTIADVNAMELGIKVTT